MTKLSMDVFSRFNYGELYGNILTADIILCPVLHGDHWCLVVIHLPEKRMVYLDSMFNGIGAQTAFSRFMNFLECMAMYHQLSPDWNGTRTTKKMKGLFSSNASASKLKTGKTNNPSSKIKKEQLQTTSTRLRL
ncbi:SUMO1 sentrin specific peptidase 1 [Desmophyllum pertusum]|uniref:SUMO1 sentrin specific peptidase 1 n=1 Tax=Desmophyllum pertusum TaxID=174260 RepID=A0A9W9Y8N8_9CNID|nr:SUMO1 sentrin specific peptidase 1 [Desmophyllum pertusum]